MAPSELIQQVMEKSGYVSELIADGTDEAEERRRNLQELVNAALQYQEENDEGDLEGFLATAALSSDADNKDTAADRVTLMTLHSSKGLEFPVVCLVGLEQGLFPSYRSLDDPPPWRRNAAFATWALREPRSVFSCPMPVSVASGVACAKRRCPRFFFLSCRKL